VPHDLRDTVVDFFKRYRELTGLAIGRMLGWLGLSPRKPKNVNEVVVRRKIRRSFGRGWVARLGRSAREERFGAGGELAEPFAAQPAAEDVG